jgi:predicted lipid-binding transport protein (Tim44 family)
MNANPITLDVPSVNGTGHKSRSKAPAAKPSTKTKTKPSKAERTRAAQVSYVVGGGCLVGLALSGIDSAFALHRFAAIDSIRSGMLALVIDGLMVGAEVATLVSADRHVRRWAVAYLMLAGALSVSLNAAELASHASGAVGATMNAIIGGLIPVLVLVSSRFAGHLYLSTK